jgi:hypothetical protein
LQIKTKIVSYDTANSKPVKQEVNGTVILSPLVFLDETEEKKKFFFPKFQLEGLDRVLNPALNESSPVSDAHPEMSFPNWSQPHKTGFSVATSEDTK